MSTCRRLPPGRPLNASQRKSRSHAGCMSHLHAIDSRALDAPPVAAVSGCQWEVGSTRVGVRAGAGRRGPARARCKRTNLVSAQRTAGSGWAGGGGGAGGVDPSLTELGIAQRAHLQQLHLTTAPTTTTPATTSATSRRIRLRDNEWLAIGRHLGLEGSDGVGFGRSHEPEWHPALVRETLKNIGLFGVSVGHQNWLAKESVAA